mgnify:CR=1 FL=1
MPTQANAEHDPQQRLDDPARSHWSRPVLNKSWEKLPANPNKLKKFLMEHC